MQKIREMLKNSPSNIFYYLEDEIQKKKERTILLPKGFDKNFECICNFSFSSYGFIIPAINKRRLFILK